VETPKLVFDVGMHEGEDTEFYLSRGCRVVGVEPNPEMLPFLQQKFSAQLKSGQLHIVDRAISRTVGTAELAVIDGRAIHSSISPRFIERSKRLGFGMRFFEVQTIPITDILHEFGTPYYLKIDIEGMDLACVETLHGVPQRPRYVSFESSVTMATATREERFAEFAHLWVLGYRHFKYVDQAAFGNLHNKLLQAEGPPMRYTYREHTSGPFGEETPGKWYGIESALKQMKWHMRCQNAIGLGNPHSMRPWNRLGRRTRRMLRRLPSHSWYDLHARLGGPA
jgi:FkbM family methyltransferase